MVLLQKLMNEVLVSENQEIVSPIAEMTDYISCYIVVHRVTFFFLVNLNPDFFPDESSMALLHCVVGKARF